VAGKIIMCRCEDVTLADLTRAIDTGFADLEEVKRYTGFGTGPCQGKECLREIALAIARVTGRAPADIAPFTSRPPLVPTELRFFAGSEPGVAKPR
jgi:sarcosine oxidase subunit beta